jgi:hypothetical protein
MYAIHSPAVFATLQLIPMDTIVNAKYNIVEPISSMEALAIGKTPFINHFHACTVRKRLQSPANVTDKVQSWQTGSTDATS